MVLRALPGPFVAWLGTLLFLLVMQFLIRHLPDIAGKDLPLGLILELISYSIAYMVVLAVPMSTLLACIMAFGRLAESRAYVVIKNSGVSLLQLIWPVLAVAGLLTCFMMYFNNTILPESNYRARGIFIDIRNKRPDFELQPGVFYDGIRSYSILVQERTEDGVLHDVLIYDYSRGATSATTIRARSAHLLPSTGSADLLLRNGEVHRLVHASTVNTRERYERTVFARHRLRLDLSEFTFKRSDPGDTGRSDRSTPTLIMMQTVDSLDAVIASTRASLRTLLPALPPTDPETTTYTHAADLPVDRVVLRGLTRSEARSVYEFALEDARHAREEVRRLTRRLERETRWAAQYRVEIYKKFAIALTCLIFALIGAPVGLGMRSGGLARTAVMALGLFIFYWTFLVQGEKLADRGYIDPWLGMWMADIILGLVGLALFSFVALDGRTTWRRRLAHPTS